MSRGPHDLVITEVMWGSDASLEDPSDSQWIELYNAGADPYKTQDGANTTTLVFYRPNEVPATKGATVKDRIGTIDADGYYWQLTGQGQSGRTGQGEKGPDIVATVPTSGRCLDVSCDDGRCRSRRSTKGQLDGIQATRT